MPIVILNERKQTCESGSEFDISIYYPVTPKIAILCNKNRANTCSEIRRIENVVNFNNIVFEAAYRYVFSINKKQLEFYAANKEILYLISVLLKQLQTILTSKMTKEF